MRAALHAARGRFVVLTLFCLTLAASAAAQQSADQVVLDLNHGAMEAYNNLDINRAGSMLEEALRVAQQGGVRGPLLAQTNLNLAIVYVGGLQDNDGGVRYFVDAVCADPSVQLDPLTSTPDIQSVFDVARQRVQQQGCPRGMAAPPPGPAPRSVPGGVPPGANIAPSAAAQTLPEEAGPRATADLDAELPPGWGQTDNSVGRAKDFRRAFVQLGVLVVGMPWVRSGMLADRTPPNDLVFIDATNGGRIVDPESADPTSLRFPGAKLEVPADPVTGAGDVGLQQQNAWEPDRDSYDGFSATEPFTSSSCPEDGIETGPTINGLSHPGGLYPSRYCVRVKKPGFAPQIAMRAAFGYFITRDVSLSLLTRFQFSSGVGTLSSLLVGMRAEYMFTKTKARGLMISGFLGGTLGQIQAQPSASNSTGNEPWIKSGLGGAHIGSNIRYRFTNNLGMYMSPELDVQFPDFLWNIDLTVLGAEFAF